MAPQFIGLDFYWKNPFGRRADYPAVQRDSSRHGGTESVDDCLLDVPEMAADVAKGLEEGFKKFGCKHLVVLCPFIVFSSNNRTK